MTTNFEKYWCDSCQLPRGTLDVTFKHQCTCPDNKAKSKIVVKDDKIRGITNGYLPSIGDIGFIVDGPPLGLSTRFAPQSRVWGISSVVLSLEGDKAIGYVFFYDVDFGLSKVRTLESLEKVYRLMRWIVHRTGSCIVARTVKGYHLISLNVIPYETFKSLASECEKLHPSDFRYLVLRLDKKANEHCIDRFMGFYQESSSYPISTFHKQLWELVFNTTLKVGDKQIDTGGSLVHYYTWS